MVKGIGKVVIGCVVGYMILFAISDVMGRDNELTANQKRLLYKDMTVEQYDKILKATKYE